MADTNPYTRHTTHPDADADILVDGVRLTADHAADVACQLHVRQQRLDVAEDTRLPREGEEYVHIGNKFVYWRVGDTVWTRSGDRGRLRSFSFPTVEHARERVQRLDHARRHGRLNRRSHMDSKYSREMVDWISLRREDWEDLCEQLNLPPTASPVSVVDEVAVLVQELFAANEEVRHLTAEVAQLEHEADLTALAAETEDM